MSISMYKEYRDVLIKNKNYYNDLMNDILMKYQELFYKYDKERFKTLMLEQKKLILEIIYNVLDNYDEFTRFENMIILTGSLARNTNLLFSDVDISFIYDNKYKKNLFHIEEQISYMLSQIFGFRGRDRVHGITFYLPHIEEKRYDSIDNNNYELKFKDKNIFFHCRKNSYETMYNTYNSTRSVYDLTKYFIEGLPKFEDWTNCYELIRDNGLYTYFYKSIMHNDLIHIFNYNYRYYTNKLLSRINEDVSLEKEYTISICKLKKKYKTIPLYNFYSLLSILYKIAIKNGIKLSSIDVNYFDQINLLNKLNIQSDLFDKFYYYLFIITKVQLKLDCLNLDLSSHDDRNIAINLFNIENGTNLISELNKQKSNLNKEMTLVLKNLSNYY